MTSVIKYASKVNEINSSSPADSEMQHETTHMAAGVHTPSTSQGLLANLSTDATPSTSRGISYATNRVNQQPIITENGRRTIVTSNPICDLKRVVVFGDTKNVMEHVLLKTEPRSMTSSSPANQYNGWATPLKRHIKSEDEDDVDECYDGDIEHLIPSPPKKKKKMVRHSTFSAPIIYPAEEPNTDAIDDTDFNEWMKRRGHMISLESDCSIEKGILHNTVYPELREHCREQGYELHIVDLHWKTSLEQQRNHEFPQLCIGELARHMEAAYVIPVIFLNNTLGTPLLPNAIEYQDFEMTIRDTDNKESLQKWYVFDDHSEPPCYRLQPSSVHIPGFKDTSPESREQALSEWCNEIESILNVMISIFSEELRDTYLTTVVEQEVHNTVFMSQELARRTLWLYRVYTHMNASPVLSNIEIEMRRRLENLKKDLRNQLSEKHILRYPVRWVEGGLNTDIPEHELCLDDVTRHMETCLRKTVDNIIEDDQAKVVIKSCYGINGSLLQELMQQTIHCQRMAQCCIERDSLLQTVKSYLLGDSRSALILNGPRCSGKSVLAAKVAYHCHHWLPEAVVVFRFVGISAQSSTMESIVRSIVDQCSVLNSGAPYRDAHTMKNYTETLERLLISLCLQRPLVIIVDGLDQVRQYGTNRADWLPVTLPENIKIVLTLCSDNDVYSSIQNRIKESSSYVNIPYLQKTEARSMLMVSVMQYNHSVNNRIQDCVRNSIQHCTSPLYIKTLAWQTSWWSNQDRDISPKDDVTEQLGTMLEDLEAILGKEKVTYALALNSVSKTGLCDSEMLDLLAYNEAFQSKDTHVMWAPSALFWAGLNKYLSPFITWFQTSGLSILRWKDQLLQDVIFIRYQEYHDVARNSLIDYYNGKFAEKKIQGMEARYLLQPNKCGKSYNVQKLNELPHVTYSLTGKIIDEYLLNHSWLYDKLCGSNVFEVLEDFFQQQKALTGRKNTADKDLSLLKNFLEECATALAYDGRQFYSHMYVYLDKLLKNKERKTVGENSFASRLFNLCNKPPAFTLIPLGLSNVNEKNDESTKEKMEADDDDLSQVRFDLISHLNDNQEYVVTVSTEREEISVWDINTTTQVRTLMGITHPINLKNIDFYECVVLCRRELRVYDLDSGTFLNRLKGVMNQKMPYYGLHDQDHLVALSRNRMYVNLMNLESGDCVTTFKAGEDRFLNSLLVSGDGRILVCGDETQKPFPLLVWNLSSRKLLYDLRIPHHDFVTSLSAITHEGHYVCCVCKEVDEPNPNFIVVYDLQSGTLFKKWKPGVNTVSLDISSPDTCVISGLEDARILVWDLVTGNCRWTLQGHTAPVNFLRLDPHGGSFLSADSICRDRSLRLWNLKKGELLAVYTPDRPWTSCDMISGGRTVVLALRGLQNIVTLKLCEPHFPLITTTAHSYGKPENYGKVFDLREESPDER